VNQLTRRHAVQALAAGAVFAAAPVSEARTSLPPARQIGPPERAVAASFRAAHLTGCPVEPHEANPIREAYVLHCRSWDSSVYLYVDEQLKGFVPVTPQGFALAAAAQASDRPLAIRYWGHNPRWCAGAGRFDGALLALDRRDLPQSGEAAMR
jgi:hypothetical protein